MTWKISCCEVCDRNPTCGNDCGSCDPSFDLEQMMNNTAEELIREYAIALRLPVDNTTPDELHAMAWGIEAYLAGRYDDAAARDLRTAQKLRAALVNASLEEAAE